MNVLHSKSRNRLDPVRVDKLIFIYTNSRSLRKATINDIDGDDEVLLEIEDQMIHQSLGKRKREDLEVGDEIFM